MNQKDYKEIAEIISNLSRLFEYDFPAITIIIISREQLVEDLADYFEKEDNLYCRECCVANNIPITEWKRYSRFNRKQFLKKAGVKE